MPNILGTGSSALLAFQRALATVGHNVANAATPGYSRQETSLTARPSQFFGSGFIGAGVQVSGVYRNVDQFVTARALDSGAELGRLSALAGLGARIDSQLSNSASGLAAPFSAFFDATQGLASQPASTAARQEALSRAESLATRFRSLDAALDAQDREIGQRLDGLVRDINGLSDEVARINVEIVRQQGMAGGQPANDLLDQRDRLIATLNSKVGVVTVPQDDGSLNVFTNGGQSLVVGSVASQLQTVPDAYRPDRLNLALVTQGASVALGSSALSGEVGGLLEYRSATLDSMSGELGLMATSLTFEFNRQHRAGMDFYGQRGGDFFAPINPQVIAHPANSGGALLSATIGDIATLSASDVELSFNGSIWTATDVGTRQPLAMSGSGTPADPFVVAGTRVEISGVASSGDRYLLQPSAGAAGRMEVALSDPRRIAAALPVRASVEISNLGTASIQSIAVTDPDHPQLLDPVTIDFIDASNYTVNGSGPFAWSGNTISANGWSLQIDGIPVAGDRLRVAANGPGSSDNGNARLFALIDERSILANGTTSLNAQASRLVSSVGGTARAAQNALDAQTVVDQQLQAEREATSGVNLDEEAANLLRFQQAYQAAAQVISVADSVFQSLLAAVRR